MRPKLYITDIAYALGELAPIEQALAGDVSPELLAKLRDNGFGSCAISRQTPVELAYAAAARLLREADVPLARIDAVVYATCSYWSEDEQLSPGVPLQARLGERVARVLLAPLGLVRASLLGVFLAESGNFASALRVAMNAIVADGLRNVLVVTADAVPRKDGEYRAMPSAVTINSDAAAACLVTGERCRGFEIEAVAQRSSPLMTSLAKGQGMQKFMEILNGLRASSRAALAAAGTRATDYATLIANNYSVQTLHGFADGIGFAREQLFVDNIARIAHTFAADSLINLSDCRASRPLSSGDRALALSSGPLTWGAVSVRVC